MASKDYLTYLKGVCFSRILLFTAVFAQLSLMTAKIYLIQYESSSEFTVIKSFPVTTVTACVLECSASSDKCHESKVETKENGQRICYLLQKEQEKELQEVLKEKSQRTSGSLTLNEKSFLISHMFFDLPLSNSSTFEREKCPLFRKGWVFQKRNVCYDITNLQLKIGRFRAIQPGNITQVKLVHVQGFVQYKSRSSKVYWGNVYPSDDCTTDNCFGTLIVDAKRNIIFPHNTKMNKYNNFNLKDFTDPKSSYITMSRNSNPYMVKEDEEFQVILSEQYHSDENKLYAGTHCIDVFFYYD